VRAATATATTTRGTTTQRELPLAARPASRAGIEEVTPAEAEALRAQGVALLDVREPDEWRRGIIPGAVLVRLSEVGGRAPGLLGDRDQPVVVYCAAGVRSIAAARELTSLGFSDAVSMAGGFGRWQREGLPWELPSDRPAPDNNPSARYARHLVMPEVGAAGQARLAQAKVLVVGAGGLGSPALLYLAAAGVGTLGIVDFDEVDLSNLQRQVVHSSERVGRPKTESAAQTLRALNPDVSVVRHDEMLTANNVARLIAGYDIVIDGTDTFETRYALNDAAVRAGTTVVHASVYRFEGQLTVFRPADGPCYRCLYPTPPPPELAPACSVAGVLGVVPGVMGLLQATEVVKLILGIGEPLVGRLLLYDALDMTFQELQLKRDPHCPACGDRARTQIGSAG
jgi:molybdopterin/thiamine biosynthesis adenylyltransferase/rhodanese-related sulfurtransferase